jgi:hypothetical protein
MLLNGDISGMGNQVMGNFKDSISRKAADFLSGRGKGDQSPNPWNNPDFTPDFGTRMGPEKFLPNPQKFPGIPASTSAGDIAGAVRAALAGGIMAARVEVRTGQTNVQGMNVNVAGGGNGGNATGLMNLMLSGRDNGSGGSGTTPTTAQSVSGVIEA